MTPGATVRLLAVGGPLQGQSFEFAQETIRIGRHPDNELQLREMAVSRRHCQISRGAEGWILEDLGSRRGTLLNGLPVTVQPLASGDLLHIGDASFLFLEGPDAAKNISHIAWNDRELAAQSTLALEHQHEFQAQLARTLGGHQRLAQELRVLLELASSLPSASSPQAVAEAALELLARTAPIEHAAVLWLDATSELQPLAVWQATATEGPLEVSRRLTQQAMQRDGAVWFRGHIATETQDTSESLRALVQRAAVAVPLRQTTHFVGMLYLEDRSPAAAFDEDHLPWLDAVGALLAPALVAAHQQQKLRDENQRLAEEAFDTRMVGESPPMQKLIALLRRVAPSDSTVLICGESGTGKELVARALHRNSRRADGPFVGINCATLTATLLESELFGHERGAFTGAVVRRAGKVEVADGGTLFLDEVGEIPLELQAKLLRVLQEREFERVGGNKPIKVDVRVVAATNRELEKSIAAGTFREDLFYRLNVITLSLPPLRRRTGDIARLAEHFVTAHGKSQGRPGLRLSPAAGKCLTGYRWPGNVRELSNAIERAVVLAEGASIEVEDLPETVAEAARSPAAGSPDRRPPAAGSPAAGPNEDLAAAYHQSVAEAKKRILRDALAEADGNFATAARRLGLRRTYLHRLVSNLGLRAEIDS